MKEFKKMMFFYGAMAGMPVLLWLVAVLLLVTAFFPSYLIAVLIEAFTFLLGIAALTFGIVGFWEVFMNG